MNGAKIFVDSNVLVYLYSDTDQRKKQIAFDAINQYDCSVSMQVFNEFSNVCIRKLHKPIQEIRAAINEVYAACDCINIDCLRRVHTPPLWGVIKGMDPETDTLPEQPYPDRSAAGLVD